MTSSSVKFSVRRSWQFLSVLFLLFVNVSIHTSFSFFPRSGESFIILILWTLYILFLAVWTFILCSFVKIFLLQLMRKWMLWEAASFRFHLMLCTGRRRLHPRLGHPSTAAQSETYLLLELGPGLGTPSIQPRTRLGGPPLYDDYIDDAKTSFKE